MNAVIWSRVSSDTQDNQRQIINLRKVAEEKGWTVRRVFEEKATGTVLATHRKEFNRMLEYVIQNDIKVVMTSEISRIGRKVIDILTIIELLHKNNIGLYIQQFNMLSYQDGKVNPMVMLITQTLSIAAELENEHRKQRQTEGIALARLQGKYTGRKAGAVASRERVLQKYADVVDLLQESSLSIRRIASITSYSINTVRRVKQMLLISPN